MPHSVNGLGLGALQRCGGKALLDELGNDNACCKTVPSTKYL